MTISEQYFNYLSKRTRFGLLYRRHWLYPHVSKYLRGRVLDVGCGIGDFLNFYPGSVGVDVNSTAVQWCRSRGLDSHHMSVDVLPFEEGSFDGVVLDNVLEHLNSPENLLVDIHRVLKPNGVLLVGVPGWRGYVADSDHKIFYDEKLLVSTLNSVGYRLNKIFYMPFKSKLLAESMRQYCVYGVFQRG